MLKPEPATEPTETADHLIGDQQDAVLATDRLDTRPVSVGWNDHAARTLHGFADERGHVLRAKPQDAFLNCVGGTLGEGLRVFPEALVERVGLHHVLESGCPGAALLAHRLHATDTHASDRGAVVGVIAGDDDVPSGLSLDLPVVADDADDGVDRFRA